MTFASALSRTAACLALCLIAPIAAAQPAAASKDGAAKDGYKPEVGQPGTDVVWVPTPQTLVDQMLEVAKVTSADFVMDLGSGDGRTVITAARLGAKAVGIEYNPDMVELAKRNAAAAGLGDKVQFMKADLFETDLSKATVITMFLLNDINVRLRPKLLDLKPGTRIVSNTFQMGDWKEDVQVTVTKDCPHYCTAYHWVIPAKVGGKWTLGKGTLQLTQKYQEITGTLTIDGKTLDLANPKLRGADISFSAGGTRYAGKVNGNAMEGAGGKWKATRTGA